MSTAGVKLAELTEPIRASLDVISDAMRERVRIHGSRQRVSFLKTIQEARQAQTIEASYKPEGTKFGNLMAETLLTLYLEEAYTWQNGEKK